MCMGGGNRGTIMMPDTGAYEQQFDLQRRAIEQQMNNSTQLMQGELQNSLRQKQELMTQIKDIKKTQADSAAALDEQAMRLSTLIGPPPPEQSAKAPLVGGGRSNASASQKKGKASLRIGRTTTNSYGQGAGLNIT